MNPYKKLTIEPLKEAHLANVTELWQARYREERVSVPIVSESWITNPQMFVSFITTYILEKRGIIVKMDDHIIGYLVYDTFDFHGEKTAFCSIMGHAALPSWKEVAYNTMYKTISKQWVETGCLNHIISFFAHDASLKDLLFTLGFGSYVVDAFRSLDSLSCCNGDDITITQAQINDLDDVMRLGVESRSYYMEAPLFLINDAHDKAYYKNNLENELGALFLAYKENKAVGILSIRKNEEDDPIMLTDTRSSLIDGIGAYILPEYRGKGIGGMLLQRAIAWCRENDVDCIHVDFESANLYANKFWPKYFNPVLYSVKRRVNQDIIEK
jgi:GNAT superfamily N-acetyltransferase